MDALRIRQMQLAMASARHELLYTRGRFINETLGPDRRAVEEWLPIPPCTSLLLLTSPHIPSHLPVSPHISPYLLTSPRISRQARPG